MRRILTVCGMAMLLIPMAAAGQSRPISDTVEFTEVDATITDAQILYQAWRTLQRKARSDAGSIALTETIDALFDSQTGAWRSRQYVTLNRALGSPEWKREVSSIETDGRIADEAEWEALRSQWSRLLGDAFSKIVEDPALPLELLKNMQPTGLAHEVMLKDERHWRIDMTPVKAGTPFERVTLWVHQESGHLSRTRAEAQLPQSSIVATTEYRRTLGVDVPYRRQLKGSVQTRRRDRIRSVFFDIQCEFAGTEAELP